MNHKKRKNKIQKFSVTQNKTVQRFEGADKTRYRIRLYVDKEYEEWRGNNINMILRKIKKHIFTSISYPYDVKR